MKKVTAAQVASPDQAKRADLPEAVQASLGELAGAAREGLLALSVGVGLGVMHELMAAEVDEVVGPKGRHDPERSAHRHGSERGSVTLGGRRVAVKRPRARSADGAEEIPLQSYEHFASRDQLTDLVFERIIAGVSSRGFKRTNEPVGSEMDAKAISTSKSTVSREFVARTRTALGELMSRRLDDVRLAALMLDGLEISERTHVVALGISTEGAKLPLGLWEGSTENATLARSLLSDLLDRGLDPEQGILFVIDGSKALRKAIGQVFGTRAPVQRCIRHKERNVLDHLPEAERQILRGRLRGAWALEEHDRAIERLGVLARELDRSHPGAAASLREGLAETVTVQRLGASEQLRRTLASTNPCESMIEIVRRTQRNVKRWSDGDMRLRWSAAGMLEAERQFRKIIGYRDLASLAVAVEREVGRARPSPPPAANREEVVETATV
ncbi:MAG: IS256 family transposase [Solirubrobacterales bacterium]